MKAIRDKIEKAYEDSTYAESGEDKMHNKKSEKSDSLEDILTAIGMAEGGDEDFAKRLHPLFHKRESRN